MSWTDDIYHVRRKPGMFYFARDEIETGCRVGSRRRCPRCGWELDNDRKYSIFCTNPKCHYREELDRDDEPIDIGEIY